MEKKFKCKDEVIFQNRVHFGDEKLIWNYGIVNYEDEGYIYLVGGLYINKKVFKILPYEGNEHLVGTNLEGTHTEKTWEEQLHDLFKQAYEIADTWSNPLRNDAGGSMCCEYVKQDMDKWIKYFESWANQK